MKMANVVKFDGSNNYNIKALYNKYFEGTGIGNDCFGEMVISAAKRTIREKNIDDIKWVMREYNRLKNEENDLGKLQTPINFLFVAAGYFFDYLKYYYGIKDKWSEFLETGSQHLHFFNEEWLYNKHQS